MTKVACIIPARDEAARIGAVIPIVLSSPLVDEVVVVDNASHDDTALVASLAGACVVECLEVGKYQAMAAGVRYANSADVFLFLDADLHNLTKEHIQSLLTPVLAEEADMVCGKLDRPRLPKFILKHWAGLTGQRALRRKVWEGLPPGKGWEVEVYLNFTCRKHSWPILRRELPGLTHIGKREKFSPILAVKEYLISYGVVIRAHIRTLLPGWGK